MATTIRHATSGDLGALIEMRRSFTLEDAPSEVLRPDYDTTMRTFLQNALNSGRWKVWVAEVGGEVVSHVYLALVDKVPRPNCGSRESPI